MEEEKLPGGDGGGFNNYKTGQDGFGEDLVQGGGAHKIQVQVLKMIFNIFSQTKRW